MEMLRLMMNALTSASTELFLNYFNVEWCVFLSLYFFHFAFIQD